MIRLVFALVLGAFIPLAAPAIVLLDDNWADAGRTTQNPPIEAAWFASSGSSLTTATNSMTLSLSSSAVMVISYFTTNPDVPTQLEVGDNLRATFRLTFSGVAAANTSQGFRLGLFNFANSTLSPKRVSADGFGSASQGDGVQGYALFQNMATTFNSSSPMDLRKRTTLSDSSLLGTSGDWTSLGSGPGNTNSFSGFANSTAYVLQLVIERTGASSLLFSVSWSNAATGITLLSSVSDTNAANFSFDGLALRPQNATSTASTITFQEAKVETTSTSTFPSISVSPQNQTVTQGQNATFTVTASGSAPLSYQWYFNTNTALANATNSSLTLTNVQFAQAGAYSVIVSNAFGTATSSVATLTVNSGSVAPSITGQPQNQTVFVSQSASFSVSASGTAPLSYQWYRNANTALANGTTATLTLSNIKTNDAGAYFVVVTNNFGAATSAVATLTVSTSIVPNFDLVGFAALDGFNSYGYNQRQLGGTTGGTGGTLVQVWTVTNLLNNLQSSATLLVEVMTNLDLSVLANHSGGFPAGYPVGEIFVRSNKTIFSKNGATISRGTLRMGKPSLGPQGNVIIRNLRFRDLWVFDPSGNYDTYGWDYVHLEEGSHHVWVDHCDFEQVYDGMIDLTHGCDFLTASWNVFRLQKKCSLIGHSDSNQSEDTNHLNVTFHHNYYVDVDERMPRMRFGNAHVFNLYCENLGGNGIQSTAGAATLVENSYFYHPQAGSLPTREENGGPTGTVKVVNSTIVNLPGVNVAFRQYGQASFAFNFPFATNQPPYPYTMDALTSVPFIVTNYAGLGRLNPNIVGQPQNQNSSTGQSASFNVLVSGANPLRYQWYFNGASLAGATNSTLALANIQASNAGPYSVVITNLFGSVTSAVATLTLGTAAAPAQVIGSPTFNNGIFHVSYLGTPNWNYLIDRATNIIGPWELGYTNLTAGSNGLFELFASNSPPAASRFYRARSQ